jgi:uncharacterized protein (DUF427 family)
MAVAKWNSAVIADADAGDVVLVEGNVYFPRTAVRAEHLQPSDTHTVCAWKGTASYYHVTVNGQVNRDAAWYYPEPSTAAAEIRDHIAFWRGVEVKR